MSAYNELANKDSTTFLLSYLGTDAEINSTAFGITNELNYQLCNLLAI